MTINEDAIGEAVRNTCILATIRCRALGMTRTDRQASDDVTGRAGAATGAARVIVSRLPGADEHHKIMTKIQTDTRADLRLLTMPYGADEGWRLLPNVNWSKLLARLNARNTEFKAAHATFLANVSTVLEKAQLNKGSLNIDMPTRQELETAYTMETEFRPINEGRFRGLPDTVAQRLSSHAEAKLKGALIMAQRDTLERFVAPLTHLIERMEKYEQRLAEQSQGKEVGRHGIFRDSVLENLKELVDVVGSFNVMGDERIDTLRKRLDPIMSLEADDLRDDARVRTQTVTEARAVLESLKDWLG